MRKFEIEIEGITPYLQNRFMQAEIEGKTKKRMATVKEKDVEDKAYKSPDGKYYIPAMQLRGCLVNSGKNIKIPGKNKATYSKIFGSALQIEPEAIVINPQKYTVFTTTAVNPMTKGRMVISRPKWDKWTALFQVISVEDTITKEVLKEALDIGGIYVGIGDWRPDKKGMYGKFMVTSIKEVD